MKISNSEKGHCKAYFNYQKLVNRGCHLFGWVRLDDYEEMR